MYYNGDVCSLWGSTRPKIRITSKKASNKSCSKSNFAQKSLMVHMSISLTSEARGSKDQYVLKSYNVQKQKIRFTLGLNIAKNTYFTKKALDKSSLESNFVQKSPQAHMSISPSSGDRGSKGLPFALHSRNGKSLVPPFSPLLFNCALDKILKNHKWENKGIKINGKFFNNLRFADDVVVVAGSAEDLQVMLEELSCKNYKMGMVVNLTKTKILNSSGQPNQVKIGGEIIETVDNIIYLGKLVTFLNQSRRRSTKELP